MTRTELANTSFAISALIGVRANPDHEAVLLGVSSTLGMYIPIPCRIVERRLVRARVALYLRVLRRAWLHETRRYSDSRGSLPYRVAVVVTGSPVSFGTQSSSGLRPAGEGWWLDRVETGHLAYPAHYWHRHQRPLWEYAPPRLGSWCYQPHR